MGKIGQSRQLRRRSARRPVDPRLDARTRRWNVVARSASLETTQRGRCAARRASPKTTRNPVKLSCFSRINPRGTENTERILLSMAGRAAYALYQFPESEYPCLCVLCGFHGNATVGMKLISIIQRVIACGDSTSRRSGASASHQTSDRPSCHCGTEAGREFHVCRIFQQRVG